MFVGDYNLLIVFQYKIEVGQSGFNKVRVYNLPNEQLIIDNDKKQMTSVSSANFTICCYNTMHTSWFKHCKR